MPFALPIRDCLRCPFGAAAAPGACPFARERRAAGRHLCFSDAPVDRAMFVKSGYVTLRQRRGEAQALRGPGTLLGSECLAPRAAAHTVTALTDVELCTLRADEFRAFSLARPTATLQLLSGELQLRDLDASFRAGSAAGRLSRFLLAWSRSGGGAYPLPLSQQTLARLLDLRAETLSRVLKQLRHDGGIDTRGLFIRDASRLAEVAADAGAGSKTAIPRTQFAAISLVCHVSRPPPIGARLISIKRFRRRRIAAEHAGL